MSFVVLGRHSNAHHISRQRWQHLQRHAIPCQERGLLCDLLNTHQVLRAWRRCIEDLNTCVRDLASANLVLHQSLPYKHLHTILLAI